MRFHAPWPAWLRDASGGALYVAAMALVIALVARRSGPRRQVAWALALTCAIELLQAWHPAWLQAIRRTLPGRLVLGTTFNWWDFPAYAAGALLALAILRHMGRRGAS